jgi:hypothetical protein
VGTFAESYEVDGEQFELYAQQGDEPSYQLVDSESLPIGAPFTEVPDQETVVALVRASLEVDGPEAA